MKRPQKLNRENAPGDANRAERIARTGAYLDATQERFVANARRAAVHFQGRIEGVLAGPTRRVR